jgi:hypothetical protein
MSLKDKLDELKRQEAVRAAQEAERQRLAAEELTQKNRELGKKKAALEQWARERIAPTLELVNANYLGGRGKVTMIPHPDGLSITIRFEWDNSDDRRGHFSGHVLQIDRLKDQIHVSAGKFNNAAQIPLSDSGWQDHFEDAIIRGLSMGTYWEQYNPPLDSR